jgi:hypothetical protein
MTVLVPGETEIASETDVRAGFIGIAGVNDAFDLYLVLLSNGNYKLIVFMKVQFFFQDGNGGKWTNSEKTTFVNKWESAIKQKWGGRVLKQLKSNKNVSIEFRFKTQIGGWMLDHWEINVEKVNKFAVSSVNPIIGNVTLDSLDLKLTRKKGGGFQRAVVHEFGHMIGLDDEYLKNSPFQKDYKSVMNGGESVLTRHDAPHMKWLNERLKEKGIQ